MISKTMRAPQNGSASDRPKAQGVKEKIGLCCRYRLLCKSSTTAYNKWTHQIVQRQETEAATQTRTSSPMSVDTQPQDEMMDIRPQDDELTGEGDHQIPVRRGDSMTRYE